MLALCALAGCFERLPEANACNATADCLPGERCVANRCTLEISDEPDLGSSDDMTATIEMGSVSKRRIEFEVTRLDEEDPGNTANYSQIAICLANSNIPYTTAVYQKTDIADNKTIIELEKDLTYDIYIGKSNQEPYYQVTRFPNIRGDALPIIAPASFEIPLCTLQPGEGSCVRPHPCFVNAFPGKHYGVP